MAIELDVWLAFFGDMTRAEFALRRAANTVPFIDIDPAIAVRLEAAAEEVAALARAFLEGGKSG